MVQTMSEVIAVDLGGTNFRMARVDESGRIVAQHKIPTKSVGSLHDGLMELTHSIDAPKDSPLIFGAPGIVDFRQGKVIYAPNLSEEFREDIVVTDLSKRLAREVVLVNDADLAAVGEASIGAAKGRRAVVYVTCSTGVGAGAVLDGKLVHGHFSGMEIGHTIVTLDPTQEVEAHASGTALARRLSQLGLALTNQKLVEEAADGDSVALAALAPVTKALGVALANLAWLFAPDSIVLGGGLGLSNPIIARQAKEEFSRVCPPYLGPDIIVEAALGDDAGIRGSAFVRAALR